MAGLSISEVARRADLRPSALRYYEQIGILPPPPRAGGRRQYDASALQRLAVVRRARQTGFTLAEVRQLFVGFAPSASAGERWRSLSHKKLAELDALLERVKTMRHLLRRMNSQCACATLEQCGSRILHASGRRG